MSGQAVALDLGSTAVKAGLLDEAGKLSSIRSRPAPPLRGSGSIREGDPVAYAEVAAGVLADLARGLPAGTPLAIASQRSTFLLWNRRSGTPLGPMISWQDRRAAGWCDRHPELEDEIRRRTGLLLSAHYAGPKLAMLAESDPLMKRALRDRDTLFGSLECWIAWSWSTAAVHETDVTMAARTSMLDLESADWCDELLDAFGVPRTVLPRVRPTCPIAVEMKNGLLLTATIADQAAGAVALLDDAAGTAMVNLGTGAFVLRAVTDPAVRRHGYLTAPILFDAGGTKRYAIEGAINGGAGAVDRFGGGPTELPRADPDPQALCLPDTAGLGAPHWRPELELIFSPEAETLGAAAKRRVVLEGLLFRVREVLDELHPDRILLSGGLAAEPFVGRGLATLLDRPVEILDVREAGLTGAARLAAGLGPGAPGSTRRVEPGKAGGYLRSKYERWKRWLASRLAAPTRVRA